MSEVEFQTALNYRVKSYSGKEVDFVHHKIANQIQAGHTVVYPLSAARGIPKL